MGPSLTFNPCLPSGLETYIDQFIITNHNNEITAEQHNNIENGLLSFILASPRNYNKANVSNSAGAFVATCNQCVLIFNSGATGSIELMDNRWNEWVIRNNSGANKQLVGTISQYLRPNGSVRNYIPSGTVVNIAKGSNNNWYEIDNGTATNTSPKALIEVVGASGGPVAGNNPFQDDRLIGLGSTNNGKIQITIDDVTQSNFGSNSGNFSFDDTTGILSGIFWIAGAGLFIDLNQ